MDKTGFRIPLHWVAAADAPVSSNSTEEPSDGQESHGWNFDTHELSETRQEEQDENSSSGNGSQGMTDSERSDNQGRSRDEHGTQQDNEDGGYTNGEQNAYQREGGSNGRYVEGND